MPANPLRDLAKQVNDLDRRVRAKGSTSQLAHSSIEDGALQAYDRDGTQTMAIGKQWDGTYAPTVTNGPVPPTPSGLIVQDATEGLIIGWDGTFMGGLIQAPMDFLRVDAHVGASSDFIPDHTNRRATFVSPQGGYASVTLPYGTYFVKLVCWTFAGKVSLASDPVEGDSWPVESSSDGFPPASSPAAEVVGGYEALSIRWTPIVNADPVTYKVHVSTTSGFTPDSTTLAAEGIAGGAFTLKLLPGDAPADPNDPDPRKLQYDTTYYVRIVAEDADGEAAPGAQGSDTIFKISGGAIGAETIVGANILGGSITADLLSSTLVLSSDIWTAMAGQRVGMTPEGFFAFKADDSLMLKIPTDGTDALFDGELIVRGATITGGISIQSNENEVTADARLTLMRGIASPTASPQMALDYEYVVPSTASLTAAQKTNNDPNWGLGGPFDFIASQASCIQWRPVQNCWSIYQVRPNGTREWYFNPDGTPHLLGGNYYSDFKDWEIWSATELLTSTVSIRNGQYAMFRYMPAGDVYWLSTPDGTFRYSRQNGIAPPAIGNNGQDIYVAEVPTIISPQTHLRIRYFQPAIGPTGGGDMPAPTVTYESTTGYTSGTSLAAVRYDPAGFDVSAGTGGRFVTAERGNAANAKILVTSGTNDNSIFPSGSGNNWASNNKDAHSFEAPAANRRGCDWDGTQFWTLSGDGRLYKHTNQFWDPFTTPSKLWGQVTFRDGDSGGTGVHETTPGTAKAFTWQRRARFTFTAPDVPDNGGVDDPDRVRFYVGRGATKPANSAMFQQYEGTGLTTITTLATTGNVPPTVNSFPNANPAKIRNDDDGLIISGDGSGRFASLALGPAGGTAVDIGTLAANLAGGVAVHIRTTAGSANFVKPAGARLHWVRIWGAGGAGGGTTGAAAPAQGEGGGGGGGGYVEKWYLDSELASSEPYTVGAGGAGVALGNGNAGGSTTFKSLIAGGGGGGTAVIASMAAIIRAYRGTGGTASGGDLNCAGDDGGNGVTLNGLSLFINYGGGSPSGGGQTQQSDFGAGPGTAGSSPGGGGSGSWSTTAGYAGGAGAAGKIEIISFF